MWKELVANSNFNQYVIIFIGGSRGRRPLRVDAPPPLREILDPPLIFVNWWKQQRLFVGLGYPPIGKILEFVKKKCSKTN